MQLHATPRRGSSAFGLKKAFRRSANPAGHLRGDLRGYRGWGWRRLRSLWDALTIPDDLRGALSQSAGPLLLIDDRIETGWTMTVAARQLREAGAPAVLPLAFAVTTG